MMPCNAENDIKTMQLYNNIDRLKNELKFAGLQDDESKQIDLKQIMHLLCLNYTGIEGCEHAIRELQLTSQSKLLDVGCGVGGPSLFITDKLRCHSVAVDLQQDIIDNLIYLSKRCGLESCINAIRSDVRDLSVTEADFDAVLSILTILHIPMIERPAVFNKMFFALKPGGRVYFEDYFARGDFTVEEQQSLSSDVYCSGAPSAEEYANALSAAGFIDVMVLDKTAEWAAFTEERLKAFVDKKQRFVDVHNISTYQSLLSFYAAVGKLFNGGHLGGACITAQKPLL